MLPCVVFFQNGVACDRAVGFDDYGASDDFSTTAVERRLLKSGEMHRPAMPAPVPHQGYGMCCPCTQALLLLQYCVFNLMLLQAWCMHPREIQMQMMTGSSCLSMYGILCAEVLRVPPRLTRIQTLTEFVYPIIANRSPACCCSFAQCSWVVSKLRRIPQLVQVCTSLS